MEPRLYEESNVDWQNDYDLRSDTDENWNSDCDELNTWTLCSSLGTLRALCDGDDDDDDNNTVFISIIVTPQWYNITTVNRLPRSTALQIHEHK